MQKDVLTDLIVAYGAKRERVAVFLSDALDAGVNTRKGAHYREMAKKWAERAETDMKTIQSILDK